MKNKKTKIAKISVSLLLTLAMVLSTIIGTNVQTVAHADSWKNYYYVNNRGAYCYNRYIYPSQATKYGVPEYCFQNPGKYHYKGAEGCYSYTVITVADTSSYPNNNSNNRYLDSYFIVWVNEISMPKITSKDEEKSGRAGITIIYASSGMYMKPTSTPMVSLRMNKNNPDLYTTFSSEYTVNKNATASWSTVGKLVQTGVNIGAGGVSAAVVEAIGWASSTLSGSSTSSKITTTSTAANEYRDSGLTKRKSIGVKLSKCSLYKSNHKVLLKFTEVYPWDAYKYYKTMSRKAEVRFNYQFSCPGGSVTYTDTYNRTY